MKRGLRRLAATFLASSAKHARQVLRNVAELPKLTWVWLKQVKYFQFLALLFGLPTVVMIWFDLEDRQTERTFRAWEVVLSVPDSVREDPLGYLQQEPLRRTDFVIGGSLQSAVEFLNREFSGFGCFWGVPWTSNVLTGSLERECIIPRKGREVLDGLIAVDADLSQIDLRGARLSRSF